jgi:membrane-bound serine protease (ClpP class)
MDTPTSITPFLFAVLAVMVVVLLLVLSAVTIGPWLFYWVLGRFVGRLDPSPASPESGPDVLSKLVGKRGVAKTLMVPSGQVQIDNVAYDAVSEGPAIEAGQAVVVIKLHTRRLIVRRAEDALQPMG